MDHVNLALENLFICSKSGLEGLSGQHRQNDGEGDNQTKAVKSE
jgi:hypothetical protein